MGTAFLAEGSYLFIQSQVSALLCFLRKVASSLPTPRARAVEFKLPETRCSPVKPRSVFRSAGIQDDHSAFRPRGSV